MTNTRYQELLSYWDQLDLNERFEFLKHTPFDEAQEFFHLLNANEQAEFLLSLEQSEKRKWLFILPLDDLADLIQSLEVSDRFETLGLLPDKIRREVQALLAYAEDVAGGIMNPKYVKLKEHIRVEEAIIYIREQAKTTMEMIYYAYIVNNDDVLKGVVSFRDLLIAPTGRRLVDIMEKDLIAVKEDAEPEQILDLLTTNNLLAIPVITLDGRMKGIVTIDDAAIAEKKEATEDMQKIAGMEALDMPYWDTEFKEMVKKRAGWLMALFIGEMFTASAMANYEGEISKAVVLAMFIPLIISSGGNSGSQASTLIIRSLALREIRLRDWFNVFGREALAGLCLGLILATIGFFRIVIWQKFNPIYGEHYLLVATTVSLSLIGIVLWGTVSGSMLPFLLKKAGFDPASASAPFVATLVDVTGLIIYFTIAHFVLRGTLL